MTLQAIFAVIFAFTVHIETPKQIQAGWEALGYTSAISAYATWDKDSSPPVNCAIHVPPLDYTTISIWVHEIEHCTHGHYHS